MKHVSYKQTMKRAMKARKQRKKDRRSTMSDLKITCPDVADPRLLEFANELHGDPPVSIHITAPFGAREQRCYLNCCFYRQDGEDIVGGYKVVSNEKFWWSAEPHFVLRGERWRDVTPDAHLRHCVFIPAPESVRPENDSHTIEKVLLDHERVRRAIAIMHEAQDYQLLVVLRNDPVALRRYVGKVEECLRLLAPLR